MAEPFDITHAVEDVPAQAGGAPAVAGGADPEPLFFFPAAPRRSWAGAGLVLALVLIAIILLLVVFAPRPGRRNLAAALAERGWVMYFKPGCGHCESQLRGLGGSFSGLVVCDPSCGADCGGIRAFPTWRNATTGEVRVGAQSLRSLYEMAAWR